MFPYNAQRQQHDGAARSEGQPHVQYHYSPQPQAAQQQRQPAAGQQVQQPQGHFYPQQYPYYQQQDPSKPAPQAQAPASGGQTAGATAVTPAASAASAASATPQPQVQMGADQQYMQHMVPAMGYHQLYQPQGHQQVQAGQPQEYPYGYRPNDYVFMMPHAAQMQVQGQAPQMVTQTVTDPTGQAAPPGIKPKVSTTLWEDENTLCFQVEARGICVARREDNDMINGTKLLNVAGMTRGRRDGLLKGERNRHVVKAGAMHLKGVWIPYDRALDFANKERIIDLLYPLFVTDIKSVLYHPNQRENQPQQQQPQTPQSTQAQLPAPVSQQTPQAAQAQVQPQVPQQQQQPVAGDDKKEKEYYQQQQYYYPQAGQDQYGRQYQSGQPQYYAEQQGDQPQFKEEEQS